MERDKESGEEKEEIHIMKPSFCAEPLWLDDVGICLFGQFIFHLC